MITITKEEFDAITTIVNSALANAPRMAIDIGALNDALICIRRIERTCVEEEHDHNAQ